MNHTKILAINGLTRSGTNLLASLVGAQSKCHASDVALLELLYLYDHRKKNSTFKRLIRKKHDDFSHFKDLTAKYFYSNYFPTTQSIKDGYRKRFDAYYGIELNRWLEYIDMFYKLDELKQINKIYEKFSINNNLDLLAGRTTGLSDYADEFLKRDSNNYWLEITRDVLDRFASSKKGHSLHPVTSFKESKKQLEEIEKMRGKDRYKVIKYEDLVLNTREVLNEIFDWLGLEMNKNELNLYGKTPDDSVFYGNSSDNQSIFQQTRKSDPVYKSSLGKGNKVKNHEKYIYESMFTQKRNIFKYAVYLYFLTICNFSNVMYKVVNTLSKFFGYLSYAFGFLPYAGIRGYTFSGVLRRIKNNVINKDEVC